MSVAISRKRWHSASSGALKSVEPQRCVPRPIAETATSELPRRTCLIPPSSRTTSLVAGGPPSPRGPEAPAGQGSQAGRLAWIARRRLTETGRTRAEYSLEASTPRVTAIAKMSRRTQAAIAAPSAAIMLSAFLPVLAHSRHALFRAPHGRQAAHLMSSQAGPSRLSLTTNAASAERLADPSAVFVVSGGSRGIGLQFCTALLARSKGTVVALCRQPERAEAVARLREQYAGRLHAVGVDLTDEQSIAGAAGAIGALTSRVDMLVNCAGILHDNSPATMPERSIASCNAEWMHRVYALNAVAPVLLTGALAPLLGAKPSERARIVANLSARVGSVSDNGLGGWWGYRMSKAALNMATRNMAIELKRRRVLAIALHPGTTDTGLSAPFQKNVKPEKLFSTEYSVDCMLKIVESIEDEHSGHLYAWDGQRIPF